MSMPEQTDTVSFLWREYCAKSASLGRAHRESRLARTKFLTKFLELDAERRMEALSHMADAKEFAEMVRKVANDPDSPEQMRRIAATVACVYCPAEQ
jgi:hypothetical protein